jgi:N-acetyl-anhydromuramyl-L-alanine amidase AmpD
LKISTIPKIKGGFSKRTKELKAIIIHTTNGHFGSLFESELNFLLNSDKVSAHYLVGKDGRVVNLLDYTKYAAWHTGLTLNPFDSNHYTIGVECHFTPRENWTVAMWKALTDLIKTLPNLPLKTHRQIAFPKGRKSDPSGVTDTWFNAWKDNIYSCGVHITTVANVRNIPQVNTVTRVKVLRDTPVFGFFTKGQHVNNSDRWLHTPEGFIHISGLR